MKVIDEKGRLFGLINILDLVVLVLLFIVVIVGVGKLTGRDLRQEPGTIPVTLEVVVNEVRQQTVDVVRVGDVVWDQAAGRVFGTITEKRVEPFRKFAETADGRFVLATVPERFDIYLQLESNAHDRGNALCIASHEIRIGTSLTFQTRDYSVLCTILAVESPEL